MWTVGADGTDPRRVLDGVFSPQYSPNGKRIVLAGKPKGKRKWGIWSMRRNGSRLRRLTDPGKVNAFDDSPDYSPDGRRIVFVRFDTESVHGSLYVMLMRADGSRLRQIPGLTDNYGDPAFAPAGDRIAVVSWSSYLGPPCAEIVTVTAAGTDFERVTNDPGCQPLEPPAPATTPSWQPKPVEGG